MFQKTKNIFFLTLLLIFIFFISKYYLSEKNIKFTNKSRLQYTDNLKSKKIDLPILFNDTNNIIVYNNDLQKFKNKRKKRFWERLITN